jgi:hypothetical protein
MLGEVYGEMGHRFDARPARALHEVVDVDLNITGCPVEKHEVVGAIAALLNGNPPLALEYPVCTECRNAENRCLLVDDRVMCWARSPLPAAGHAARPSAWPASAAADRSTMRTSRRRWTCIVRWASPRTRWRAA